MDVRAPTHPPDRLIARVAARQSGVVARRQLVALGLSRGSIEKRVTAGRLHRIHRGVYAVGHPAVSRTGRLMAAVLACGEGAVGSHRSAGEQWGIHPWNGAIEVTTPSGRGRRVPGFLAHRAAVPATDRTTLGGIPITTPGRTLVDLADVLSRRATERAIDQADYLRLDCSGMSPIAGRPGRWKLERIIESHRVGSTMTRSDAEERFLALCREQGLPDPEINVHLEGHEVDFLWRDHGVVVEVDGFASHGTRAAFERDRTRDSELIAAGYQPLRMTFRQLVNEPREVVARVNRVLALRLPGH
jgi:very-short-patch-repair endonuclease